MKLLFKLFVSIFILASAYLLLSQGLYTGIYRTPGATPFAGASFYNPYANLDSSTGRLKANFHGHTLWDTRHDYTTKEYLASYDSSGYDYVSISDHNIVTLNPSGALSAYEHGYNLNNFHLLLTGTSVVDYSDVPLMFMPRHQIQGSVVRHSSDSSVFLSINHPERLRMVSESVFDHLSGYRFMELNPDGATGAWDRALSAGRFVVALGSDDAHSIENRQSWFQRCFTVVLSNSVDSLFSSLYDGSNYVVTISTELNNRGPHGDFPQLTRMQVLGDTLSVFFSENCTSLRFITRFGEQIQAFGNTSQASINISASTPYVRVEATFSDGNGGEVRIFTNPVIRTSNSSVVPATSPLPDEVVWLTWLNRICWTVAMTLLLLLLIPIWRRKKRVRRNFEDLMWGAGQKSYDQH